jgi:hypothetical protein
MECMLFDLLRTPSSMEKSAHEKSNAGTALSGVNDTRPCRRGGEHG